MVLKFSLLVLGKTGMPKMTQPTVSAPASRSKGLSPDLAEILKMLNALEGAAKDQPAGSTRS
jgi:hypothetical protein